MEDLILEITSMKTPYTPFVPAWSSPGQAGRCFNQAESPNPEAPEDY